MKVLLLYALSTLRAWHFPSTKQWPGAGTGVRLIQMEEFPICIRPMLAIVSIASLLKALSVSAARGDEKDPYYMAGYRIGSHLPLFCHSQNMSWGVSSSHLGLLLEG